MRALRVAAAGLLIALVPPAAACRREAPPARASVVLVTIDTLRADRVGAYGASTVRTPALDRLASRGVRFTAAYATSPLTLPSHASMLSGRLPVAHTVRTNDGYRVPDRVPLVAERLRAAGFRTGAVVGSRVLRRTTGIARGFDDYDDEMGGAAERKADDVVARALAWVNGVGEAPFFLWVHLYDPHLPYEAPADVASAYPGSPYEAEVAYADRALGRLIDALHARRDAGRPAIVVAADHGEGLGEHGERSHGVLLFDTTVRVPLIVQPARPTSPRVVAEPVSTARIAPTLLQLAGIAGQGELPGLLDPVQEAEIVPSESLYLAQQLGWSPIYAARVGRWKVVEAPTPALYDLESDPDERQDVSSMEAATLARLRMLLERELRAAAGRGAQPDASSSDPQAARELAALGYVSGGGGLVSGFVTAGGIDPYARMEVWDRIERGLELANTGKRDEARQAFESVLRGDPDNVLALKFLGADALSRGDLRRAIALNERVAARGVHVADALSNAALAHFRAGDLRAAIDRARGAVRADPAHPGARANLALALLSVGSAHARNGDTQAAIAAFEEAAAAEPANLDVLERLGAALHQAGRREEARSRFEAVVAAAPERRAPRLSLALLDLEAGRVREAAASLERISEGWPGAYQAQFYLGEAYRRLGETQRARAAYEAAAAAAPPGDPVATAARRARAAVH